MLLQAMIEKFMAANPDEQAQREAKQRAKLEARGFGPVLATEDNPYRPNRAERRRNGHRGPLTA